MPELPEVEHLRSSLEPRIVGRTIRSVTLSRPDVLRNDRERRGRPGRLLAGTSVTGLLRRGKQLAIVGADGRVVIVHLGMSGQLRWIPAGARLADATHVHCRWTLADDGGRLLFRDPRRFGGLWTFPSTDALRRERWDALGPDALAIGTDDLARRLSGTRRPIKAALLDQGLVAGLGNIYVDEALFAAGIHPRSAASAVPRDRVRRLAGAIRPILRRAIAAGGTTLRDYVDADGRGGEAGTHLWAYGRGGQPCRRCNDRLEAFPLAQRTTVACGRCQRLFSG